MVITVALEVQTTSAQANTEGACDQTLSTPPNEQKAVVDEKSFRITEKTHGCYLHWQLSPSITNQQPAKDYQTF